jgi:hypothetical protein
MKKLIRKILFKKEQAELEKLRSQIATDSEKQKIALQFLGQLGYTLSRQFPEQKEDLIMFQQGFMSDWYLIKRAK